MKLEVTFTSGRIAIAEFSGTINELDKLLSTRNWFPINDAQRINLMNVESIHVA